MLIYQLTAEVGVQNSLWFLVGSLLIAFSLSFYKSLILHLHFNQGFEVSFEFRAPFKKVNFLNCLIHLNLKIVQLFVIEMIERGSVSVKLGNNQFGGLWTKNVRTISILNAKAAIQSGSEFISNWIEASLIFYVNFAKSFILYLFWS